jgi:N-acetylglutamate synthase-like GNAT family acetyltransferase
MHVRAARQSDLAVVQDIERAAGGWFREIGMPEIAEDEPLPIEELVRYLQANRAWVAVDDDDVPAAYLIADIVDGSMHIEQVSVHPRAARHKIGHMLMEHCAADAASKGIHALTLTTFADVPWNAPYYARCGFRVLDDSELSPGMRLIRDREISHGLHRWPRVCMRRDLDAPLREDAISPRDAERTSELSKCAVPGYFRHRQRRRGRRYPLAGVRSLAIIARFGAFALICANCS